MRRGAVPGASRQARAARLPRRWRDWVAGVAQEPSSVWLASGGNESASSGAPPPLAGLSLGFRECLEPEERVCSG